ncbi:MAG: hypothetical protein J6K73_09765 [Clostridia bacterium]|nr:hypothetical protein [Clostridia bacterium]MBP3650057.1 hypothetical protein [Clostridia bacterium]
MAAEAATIKTIIMTTITTHNAGCGSAGFAIPSVSPESGFAGGMRKPMKQ